MIGDEKEEREKSPVPGSIQTHCLVRIFINRRELYRCATTTKPLTRPGIKNGRGQASLTTQIS